MKQEFIKRIIKERKDRIRNRPKLTLHDFVFPSGNMTTKTCRLRTNDMEIINMNLRDIMKKFDLTEPTPVIVLAGA